MPARILLPVAFLVSTFGVAAGQDSIPPETLTAVKRATVFIQVSSTGGKATGSGFVVSVDKDTVLVATNHHVIGLPENDKKTRLLPSDLSRSLRLVTVNVVFDPGTKNEVSMKAEPVAADPDEDLAVLKVVGVKNPPRPIGYTTVPQLTETMPVFTFGFPFGNALATSKGAPAITVGKGSISSLRMDDDGELAVVQIDGALNPGNSGGPVVDVKGQLVGVAVATIRNGQGIGFAVPGAQLGRMMAGRLGQIHITSTGPNGKKATRAEVEVVDPTGAVNGVSLVYAFVPPNGKKPDLDKPLEKHPGAKTISLKVTGDLAGGELALESTDGTLYVQAVPLGGLGTKGATAVRDFSMTAAKGAGGTVAGPGGPAVDLKVPAIGAKPPAGWKDHIPKDRTYVVWVPEKNAGQRDSERFITSNNIRIKINALFVDLGRDQLFTVEELIIPSGLTTNRRAEWETAVRDILLEHSKGKLADSFEVRMGVNRGREFRIQTGKTQIRARIFVVGNRIMVLQSEGTREFVEGPSSGTFLDSCRLMVGNAGNAPRPEPGPRPGPGPAPMVPPSNPPLPPSANVPAERKSVVQGGSGPEYAEEAPEGGTLVGLDIALGDFLGNSIVYAVRPVWRAGGTETPGTWRGPLLNRSVRRIIAKPGYSVGAITLSTGLGIDRISLTYMREANGKLNPADSYQSEFVGGNGGGGNVKVGGDGRLVVGLLSKSAKDWISGLGFVYAEQPAAPPPAPPPAPMPSAPPEPETVQPPPKSTPVSPPPTSGPSPAPPPSTAPEPEKKKSRTPVILAGVVGAISLFAAIGCFAFAMTRAASNGKSSRRGGRRSRYD